MPEHLENLSMFRLYFSMSAIALCSLAAAQPHHPELAALGDSFRIALLADPQLSKDGSQNPVAANAAQTLSEAVAELNTMDPKPAFAVFVGDLVNIFEPQSVDNFEKRVSPLEMTTVLVHGNHDSKPPYEPFMDLQVRVNGTRAPYYSFEAGPWHMVVLPCNLQGESETVVTIRNAMMAWLKEDLAAHADRPTMVFEHLHLMPQGLTQTEWYTFEMPVRKQIIETLTTVGNVKYVFHGHVHNGIRVSEKCSWTYKGVNFVNVPTIIASRPYGETEVDGFAVAQQRAGYYMLADINGADVTLTGRAAGVAAEYRYPNSFQPFDPSIEPRWLSTLPEFTPNTSLLNGGFENGLGDWLRTYRYSATHNPGFVVEAQRTSVQEGELAASVYTGSRGVDWANDEMNEIYQVVSLPSPTPMVSAAYQVPEAFKNGGGYVRIEVMRDKEFQFLLMARWGENEAAADYLPRAIGFAMHGTMQGWRYLQELGEQKRGLYLDIDAKPGAWRKLDINLAGFYDAALGQQRAYAALGANKAVVALGTWCNKEPDSQSRACFDAVSVTSTHADQPSTLDGATLTPGADVFKVGFAQALVDRQVKQAERDAKKNVD
jgi:hypothetical protein